MFHLFEHAGFEDAHDEHHWWIYDARVTSPKTCLVCIALDGTHYRGDEIELAFPYHVHMRVNAVKAMVHPHCRCVLRWAGRTEDVMTAPYGIRRPRKKAVIPKRVKPKLSPDQKRQFKTITKHAREVYGFKNFV